MLKLYSDGGVVKKNPSPIGGTWAYVLVRDDQDIIGFNKGFISPQDMGVDEFVTNNQTELLAMVEGLSHLKHDAIVEICSDSEITLGRMFRGYALKNIPAWLVRVMKHEQERLIHFKKFTYTLMDGHPTAMEVQRGIGKKGHITSKYNVLCDDMCNQVAQRYKDVTVEKPPKKTEIEITDSVSTFVD